MADVFISYSRIDRPVAERLAAALRANGLSMWMDAQLTSGSTFTKVTEEELNKAGKVVVLWSKTSIDSGWVCDEAQLGREQGKLVPLSIDGSLPPMGFRQLHVVDVTAWAAGRLADLPAGVIEALSPEAVAAPPLTEPVPAVARKRNLAIAIMAVLLAAIAATTYFGAREPESSNHVESNRRIPVIVQSLRASGNGDGDEVALASGISDELIVRLRRIPELQIGTAGPEGRPTSGAFASAYLVDGNIRSNGDLLRVTARLASPDGEILWTDTFDGKLVDLFGVQDKIASSIAGALSIPLNVGVESSAFGGTANAEAYANYVKARSFRYNRDPNRPIGFLERAISLDPNYAKALAELNYAYGTALYSARSKREADLLIAKMDETSSRAMQVNPELWIGQAARGWFDLANSDFVSADARFQKVAGLDTGQDPELKSNLADFESQMGRYRKAAEIRRSMNLIDPIYESDIMQVQDLVALGRYDEALQRYSKLDPEKTIQAAQFAPIIAFWANLMSGRTKEAAEIGKGIHPMYASVSDFHFDSVYLPNLPPPVLSEWADRAIGYGGRSALALRAMVASHFGYQDLALGYLRLAYQRPGMGNNHLIWHPSLAKLRKTPAFAEFVKERGFVAAWRKSGDWGDYCEAMSETTISCH